METGRGIHSSGPLRVLMVTPRFAPEIGGVETHVLEVTQRLLAAGVEAQVLTTDRSRSLPPAEHVAGVPVRRLGTLRGLSDLHLAPALLHEPFAGRWDVVHVQSYHTFVAPLAMRACLRQGVPYVLTFHGGGHSSRLRQRLRGPQWRLLAPLMRRAARLVATAGFEIEEYGPRLGLPRERFVLIPNGSDLPAGAFEARPGAAARAGAGGTDREELVVSIGRLERYKGHQRVIAALPALLELRPAVQLALVGSGPYEPDLRRLTARLGLSERVRFLSVPGGNRQRMAEILSQARAAVQLSEFETHPMAVLEARAAGLPVLVADTSGLSELAASGHAVSVSLDAPPAEVARSLARLIEDPPPSRPLSGLSSWDECAGRLLELYREVAARP